MLVSTKFDKGGGAEGFWVSRRAAKKLILCAHPPALQGFVRIGRFFAAPGLMGTEGGGAGTERG